MATLLRRIRAISGQSVDRFVGDIDDVLRCTWRRYFDVWFAHVAIETCTRESSKTFQTWHWSNAVNTFPVFAYWQRTSRALTLSDDFATVVVWNE